VDTLDTAIDAAGHHHGQPNGGAEVGVTELYGAHAVAMIRIALLMLGDRAAAEDVVQDAFFGLYRRWSKLSDPANALTYVRVVSDGRYTPLPTPPGVSLTVPPDIAW
jgi:hypothetical protein